MTKEELIAQIAELQKKVEEFDKQAQGACVLVRTYSAGVHFGELAGRNGTDVVLVKARRIHYWEGAFTLSAVATEGIDAKNSRVSCEVPVILLTQAIEVIPLTIKGLDNLRNQPVHKP